MKASSPPSALCGTATPLSTTSVEARESMLDAVRDANGRRALRPAETVDSAAADIETFLIVPEWAEGETAASVAAEVLREAYGLDAATHAFVWTLYAEGARRLGFPGDVPVPAQAFGETGPAALA